MLPETSMRTLCSSSAICNAPTGLGIILIKQREAARFAPWSTLTEVLQYRREPIL